MAETDFIYGISNFARQRGDFPALPVINMLAENVPTEPGTTLQSRPGLENTEITMGSGPIRGLYTADGVLSNGLFGVSDNKLYNEETLVGNIDGTGPVSFCGYEDYVFINAGQSLYKYDGTTLSAISFPDSASVAKIVVGASRLIAIRAGTGTVYWTDPLGVAIDPLDFATAENSPDSLKDMLYIGDKLILFGAETVEFWPVTDDDSLPFAPLVGAVFPVGIKGTGMAAAFNRSFAWVTNYNEICVGEPENIISEPELQIKIAESGDVSLFTFYVDDNEYLCVRLDSETWAYGARSGVWSKLESYGQDNFVCQCYDGGYFGTDQNGTLAQWSDNYEDFDGPMERRFRAWAAITTGTLMLSNVVLRTNPGTTPYITGDYTDPTVEARTSRDGGFEWQPWRQKQLGSQGQYRRKTIWTSLGQFSYPGALMEFRVTDPVPFRISGLGLNEPYGGR